MREQQILGPLDPPWSLKCKGAFSEVLALFWREGSKFLVIFFSSGKRQW